MNLTLFEQIAGATKAKAAVINEKLEWEELDKQEQVFLHAVALCGFYSFSSCIRSKRRLQH